MKTPWLWLMPIVVMAACDGARGLVPGAGTSEPGGGGTFKERDGSVAMATLYAPAVTFADAAVVVAPSPDAGGLTPTTVASVDGGAGPEVTPSAAPRSCEELAAGGEPDALVDFEWEEQTGTCSGSSCWTYVFIETGCSLRVQRDDTEKTFVMTAADCAAARGCATNARFLDVIRNGTGCSDGATPESFELTLVQGDGPRRKTWGCAEPTVALERTCLGALADRVYPR